MHNDLLGKLGILSVSAVLGLTACTTDPDAPADETSTGDGDGDATTGDGDGDATTGDGDGDATTGDGDGDGDATTGDGDGDTLTCAEFTPGAAADGEACATNADCASYLCEKFQDVPPVDGTCQPAPADCNTRIMGRVLDFTTRETVADMDLRVVQAIQASVNPGGAPALASGTSDAEGVIDTTSDAQVNSPLGIVGLTEGEGYFLTATGLASPIDGNLYPPANTIRDIWVVPSVTLTNWSEELANDAAFTDYLPLGEAGGVVGLVRDATTGEPIMGAVLVSTDEASDAVVRYLSGGGNTFTADNTSEEGVFVIVNPGLGERFNVEIGGQKVLGTNGMPLEGTAGSANGAIFTLIMNVPG